MRFRDRFRAPVDWRRLATRLAVVAALVALAPVADAATTSRLTGSVVDNDGGALPGVTVRLSSDVLIGGQQIAITDTDGRFAFNLLPPGEYLVEAELSGFQPAQISARVALDRETQVRMTMLYEEFAGEIEVTAEAPVVDVTRVNTGQSYNEQFLQNASVGSGGRDYLDVIGQEAGSVGSGNVNVFGSVNSDNVYLVDGLNTTDPVTATFGTNFNFDAIQEVSIQTGGYDAEFGQALGGVVNLVTKSGGNEFSGAVDVRYSDDSFAESGDHFDPDQQDSSFEQYSGTLGGPIVRDRVWFFTSVENNITEQTPANSSITRTFDGINWIGKITWQASDSHRVTFKASGDPADVDGANGINVLAFTEPEAEAVVEQGGEIFQAELNSVLSDSMLFSAQAGINRQALDVNSASGDTETPGIYNFDTGIYSVNYFNTQISDRDSDQYKAALSWFVDDLAGSHEFKGGIEYRRLEFAGNNHFNGDQFWNPLDPSITTDADFNGDGVVDFLIYNNDPGFRDIIESEGDLYTAYVQDVWRPTPNVTIRPGIRYDSAAYTNQQGTEVSDFSEIQPRVGVAWDITGDAKNVLRVNAGRFMHPASVNLADTVDQRQLSREIWVGFEFWCGVQGICDPATLESFFGPAQTFIHPTTGIGGDYYFNQDIGGEPFQTVDTLGVGSLEAQYADQYTIGYERALWDETKIEFQYVKKETRDLIEDVCNNNTWAWGQGPAPSLDDPSTWTDPANCTGFVLTNLDQLKRDYEGWVAKFETRYKGLFVTANYTYSESEGSSESTASRSYAAAFYDEFPRDYYNTYGRLSDDREHRFKVNGYWLLPYDVSVGFDFFYSSEAALDFQASCGSLDPNTEPGIFCNGSTSGTLLLEPRGSRRADNDRYELDLQVAKGFTFGDVRLEGIAAVVNVFSDEQGVAYQETTGQSVPWGTATRFSQPRRYEIGFRLEF